MTFSYLDREIFETKQCEWWVYEYAHDIVNVRGLIWAR